MELNQKIAKLAKALPDISTLAEKLSTLSRDTTAIHEAQVALHGATEKEVSTEDTLPRQNDDQIAKENPQLSRKFSGQVYVKTGIGSCNNRTKRVTTSSTTIRTRRYEDSSDRESDYRDEEYGTDGRQMFCTECQH